MIVPEPGKSAPAITAYPERSVCEYFDVPNVWISYRWNERSRKDACSFRPPAPRWSAANHNQAPFYVVERGSMTLDDGVLNWRNPGSCGN